MSLNPKDYSVNFKPLCFIKTNNDIKFECYHCSVKCYIESLSKIRIIPFICWNQIEESFKFSTLTETENKKSVYLNSKLKLWTKNNLAKKSISIIVRNFEYFRSRALYTYLLEPVVSSTSESYHLRASLKGARIN